MGAHARRLHLRRRRHRRLDPGRRGLRGQARRLPGLRPHHDLRPAGPGPAGRATSAAICAPARRPGAPGCKAPTPPTPGCRLWCGEDGGWIGFDPTNALIVADDHIVLAIGRDYSDVAPIDGILLAPGDQTLKVEVDVVPDDQAGAVRP